MIGRITTFMTVTCLCSPVLAMDIGDVQESLQQALMQQNVGDNVKLESARFVVNQTAQFSLGNIANSGLTGDYNIDNINTQIGNRFSATLSADGSKIQVQGRFAEYIEVPVLAHILNKGDIVRESDIKWVEISSKRLRDNVLTNPQNIIGQQVTRRLRVNRPIADRDVHKPIVVKKGGVISIVYRSDFMDLKTVGKALQAASDGDVISIKNLKSGAVIQAMVSDSGEAVVNYHQILAQKAEEKLMGKRG